MAGEGTKYIKRKTLEACKKLFQNYLAQNQAVSNCTIAKLNFAKQTATFPDGSEIPVKLVGDIGTHAPVCKIASQKSLAHNQPAIKAVIGGKRETAFVMEAVNDLLYIRKVGTQVRYLIPQLLPTSIEMTNYAGGFSSDGKMFFVGGADNQDNGANVVVYWAIAKNFTIRNDQLVYDSVETGSINLNEKFRDEILPEFSPPGPGERETTGLAGIERCKYIYRFWPDENNPSGDPISNQEIIDFINYLIDYFELTEEEVEALFPPLFWVLVFRQTESNRFFPSTHIQYNCLLTPPIEDPSLFGRGAIIENSWNGFRTANWSFDDNCLPLFMEINFAFNNDSSGQPVLDIIASYQTTTVYKVDEIEFETYLNTKNSLGPPLSDDPIQVVSDEGYYTRYDIEAWSYTYPDNYAYIEPLRGSGNIGFLDFDYTITNPADGVHQHNFMITSGGTRMLTTGFDNSSPGSVFYKPVLWFDVFAPPDGLGGDAAEGIAVGVVGGGDRGGQGVFYSRSQFFGGLPYVQVYYPPDIGEYTYLRYDGTTLTNPNNIYYPVPPEPFMTYYPFHNEPAYGAYTVPEDTYVWGSPAAFANVYQFGRGVMAITNITRDPGYRYIDRPPAAPNDYDHLDTSYLGVNGSRALLVKEDKYSAYAYSQEYVATSNQIVGLDRPDVFTDIIYVDKGTWPYQADFLKAVNSNDFVQYATTIEDGEVNEFITNIHVEINPTVVTIGKRRSGKKPNDEAEVIDYVIKGSSYED